MLVSVVYRQVELQESDIKSGLKLSPAVREVTATDRPVDGIRFVQYRARISGAMHCLGISCLYSLVLSLQYSDVLLGRQQGL